MTPGEFWWSELTISTTDHVIFVIRPELHNIETIKYVLCYLVGDDEDDSDRDQGVHVPQRPRGAAAHRRR